MSLLESGPSRFQSEPRVDFDFRPTEQLQEANFEFSENNKRLHRRTTNGEKEKGYASNKPKGTIRDASE
jgi:hypothetical protein